MQRKRAFRTSNPKHSPGEVLARKPTPEPTWSKDSRGNKASTERRETSRVSVEKKNQQLLTRMDRHSQEKYEKLFKEECPKCGEVYWYHQIVDGKKICPGSANY